jgi:hypothetical protein
MGFLDQTAEYVLLRIFGGLGQEPHLGVALKDQGIRTGGEAGRQLLGEAVAAYQGALEVYQAAGASYYVELIEGYIALAERERERLLAEMGEAAAGE